MSRYIRAREQGGCYFFTVVTYRRTPHLILPDHIARLCAAFAAVRKARPFVSDAIVVLPDHLHCIWRLPQGDADYSERWRQIKRHFSLGLAARLTERREKQLWQRRYWEHLIRDEQDWRRHLDYIHYNPVKHGYVNNAGDWRFSSFRRCVVKGWYTPQWGASEPRSIVNMDCE